VEVSILRLSQPRPIGIDTRPPGVKIATLVQTSVFGGRGKHLDDIAVRTISRVRQIVRLGNNVAVVADHIGAAKRDSRRW
jgi:isoquinoline 1-oxidoreductase beta subunit